MDKNAEILALAQEILKNIELQEFPLSNIALRCARLARINNNQSAMDWFKYELSGYPKDENGFVPSEAFAIAKSANRTYIQTDKDGKSQEFMFTETIAELEVEVDTAKEQMKMAIDPAVSLSSSNQYQHVVPISNARERKELRIMITKNTKQINQLKIAYYNHVLGVYYESRLINIIEDIFKRRKIVVDKALSVHLPKTLEKFVSVYEKMESENTEDWSTALTSCRRVLKDVADFLYPATDVEIEITKGKVIKLTDDKYIMRIKQFIKENQGSDSFNRVIGSNLEYIGDRLDSIYAAASKGTHADVSREEAERYVIQTYLLLADVLSLYSPKKKLAEIPSPDPKGEKKLSDGMQAMQQS